MIAGRASASPGDAVQSEVEALHRFFVEWFGGACAGTEAELRRGLLQRLDEAFVLVPPAGLVLSRDELTASIKAGYGSNPAFRIAIRNVQVRRAWDGHLLATYEEWQRNARASSPPDNARIASVLFDARDGLKWLHVHETWLPESVTRVGSFDF